MVLTTEELEQALSALEGWEIRAEKLTKAYRFSDFVAAFGFLTQVALLAEAMNHHPEIRNVFNRVTLELTTHDAGGISQKDIDLAHKIDHLA